MDPSSRIWLTTAIFYLITYFSTVAAAIAAGLKMAPIIAVVAAPFIMLISS